jgi:hypothetical protein
MAQAAFFVNDLKVIDKGGHLVLEGTHTCQGGHVTDVVFIKVPASLKHLFTGVEGPAAKQAPPKKPPKAGPRHNRIRRHLEGN